MANENKGRISGWFNKARDSKRWRKNSDYYQAVIDAANEYEKQMEKGVTLESSKELEKIGEKLKKAANDYLTKRKNPKTDEGKARYNYVEQVSKLIRHTDELRDPDAIRGFQAEGKKLRDLVDVERNQKVVDITNQEKKIYGAGASKRVRFNYEGNDGFFTPNEEVTLKNVVEAEEAKMKKENPKLWEKMGSLRYGCGSGIENTMSAEDSDLKIIKYYKQMGMDITSFTEAELSQMVRYHKEIVKIMTFIDTARMAEITGETVKTSAGNEVKANEINGLSKRNTATSRVAGMLGMEDKVAKSRNIKIVDNGIETEGSFMETAKGIDSRSVEGRNKILSKGEVDLTAGSLQRDINRMQVLDMVCGQIDRHGGNFFYQISENPVHGKYQITGLQGIDNDMAFGKLKLNAPSKLLPHIDTLTLIDEEVLVSLKEFTPDKIKFTLGEMLNEDEINAVISRRKEILDKAGNGQLRVVKANEWGEGTLEAIQGSPYYQEIKNEITKLPAQLEQENRDIVNEYDAAVERVKAYNEKNPNNKQLEPKKPEHYDEYKKDKEVYEYDKKMEEIKKWNTNEPEPKKPEYYDEYKKDKAAREYQAEVEKRESVVKRLADMMGINNLAIDRKTLEDIRSKGGIDAKTGRFQKDISKLQVFALLCGQENIHSEKIAYKSGEKLADGVRLQGMSKDMIFGAFKLESYEKTEKDLANLKVIDEDVLSNCYRFFEKEKIEAMFGDLLSKEEMKALETRARAIVGKTRALENQTAIIKSNEWGEHEYQKGLTEQNPYYKAIKQDIMEIAAEEYENGLKNNSKELPSKPVGYEQYKEQQFKEFDEKIEKMSKEGTLPRDAKDLPTPPYGYAKYKSDMKAVQRLANNSGIALETAQGPAKSQQVSRQSVSLKNDLAPKSETMKISGKQASNQMQRENSGLNRSTKK